MPPVCLFTLSIQMFAYVDCTSCEQMLVLRSDWQAALPVLTQLGNGLALVSCLDTMLAGHADRAFMQVAPMLGITRGPGGYMQCPVSVYNCDLPALLPLGFPPPPLSPKPLKPLQPLLYLAATTGPLGLMLSQWYPIEIYYLAL